MDSSLRLYLQHYQTSSFVFGSFGFICCSVILLFELKYSFNTMRKNHDKKSNKWSDLWSRTFALITISMATLSQFLVIVDAFPTNILPICIYTTPLMVAIWGQKLIFLGLFQIKRLEVLTADDAYAYGKTKFHLAIKALYICAIIISVISASLISGLNTKEYGKYGCIWEFAPIYKILSIPAMILYLCWDGSTLIAYIFKQSQYRKRLATSINSTESNNEINVKNVQRDLSKILLLTVIYEILSGGAGIGQVALSSFHHLIGAMYWFLVALSDIAAALMLFLMQKHNHKQFQMFKHILWKAHLLHCCPRLAEDATAESMNDEKNIQMEITAAMSISIKPTQNEETTIGSTTEENV